MLNTAAGHWHRVSNRQRDTDTQLLCDDVTRGLNPGEEEEVIKSGLGSVNMIQSLTEGRSKILLHLFPERM